MLERFIQNLSLKRFFRDFFGTLSVIFLSLFFFTTQIAIFYLPLTTSPESVLLVGISCCFIAIFFWFTELDEESTSWKYIQRISSRLFLLCLYIITLSNINIIFSLDFPFIDSITPILALLSVFIGSITFYANKSFLEEAEVKQSEELQKVWCKSEKVYTFFFVLIAIAFIIIRIGMPFVYSGSYMDESMHLFSGIQFLQTGHFAQLYYGTEYVRGEYVSVLAGILMLLFGKTVFVAKFLPATIGIINFSILFYLSKTLFRDKFTRLLLLTTYTILPLFVVNHFYIRMYVFYEFFILAITELFSKIINNPKKTSVRPYYLTIFLFFLILFFYSHDDAQFLVLGYSSFFIAYIVFTKTEKIRWEYKVPFVVIGFLCTILYLLNTSMIGRFLSGTVMFSSAVKGVYYELFLRQNLLFTAFFLISVVFFFIKGVSLWAKLVIFSSFSLFCVHVVSAPDLHLLRTTTYFLPIFYLVSCFSISFFLKIYKTILVRISLFAMVITSVLANYPADFLTSPDILGEVHYKDYQIGSQYVIKNYNPKTLVLFSSQDQVNIFNGIKYSEIYSLRDNKSATYSKNVEYTDMSGTTRNVMTDVPVLENAHQFDSLISRPGKTSVLFIDQDLTSWITPATWTVINKRFKIVEKLRRVTIYEFHD